MPALFLGYMLEHTATTSLVHNTEEPLPSILHPPYSLPQYSDLNLLTSSKARFDRTELRFRTTAFVPVITLKAILAYCYPSEESIERSTPKQSSAADPVAGWALLLHELNLTHIPFDTTYVLTDYLPGDIIAAPALASVESLVILALMRGCTALRLDADDFLTAIGPSMQLDFQTHPTMGFIGTYRHFAHGRQPFHMSEEQIYSVINEARGHITFDHNNLFVPFFRLGASMECELIYAPFTRVFNKAISVCNHHHHHCTGLRKAIPEPNCQALFNRDTYNNRDICIFTALLIGDHPLAAKVFPTRGTRKCSSKPVPGQPGTVEFRRPETMFRSPTTTEDLASSLTSLAL